MIFLYVQFFLRPLTWLNYQWRRYGFGEDKWFWADQKMVSYGYYMGKWRKYSP
jgi:hypothetical protein